MERIVLFDPINDGHHLFYNYTVAQALTNRFAVSYCTSGADLSEDVAGKFSAAQVSVVPITFRKYKNVLARNLYQTIVLLNLFRKCSRDHVIRIHLLHFDNLYFALWGVSHLLPGATRKLRLTITCHWAPRQRLKWMILSELLSKGYVVRVFVHGDHILGLFRKRLGPGTAIVSVEYPAMKPIIHSRAESFARLSIEPVRQPILLCFGALRFDKGIDIMVEALSHVHGEYYLMIVGEDQFFSHNDIVEMMQTNHVPSANVLLRDRYVSDDELHYYFSLADIVVLPYRRQFSGQSGPLIEGLSHGCLVLGPNIGQIRETLLAQSGGVTFECENPRDLAVRIDEMLPRVAKRTTPKVQGECVHESIVNFSNAYCKYV